MIDMISVECAASGVDPAVLAEAKGKDLMVGVIDVGTEEVENAGKRSRSVFAWRCSMWNLEHLYPCTDCGMIPRSRTAAQGKMQALADGAWLVRAELQQERSG